MACSDGMLVNYGPEFDHDLIFFEATGVVRHNIRRRPSIENDEKSPGIFFGRM